MVVKKVKALDDSQEGIMLATDQDGSTSAFAMVPFNRYVNSVTSPTPRTVELRTEISAHAAWLHDL